MKKNFKRFLSLLMAGFMIASSSQISVSAEGTGLNGSGTEADPYRIGTLEELTFFRDSVNAGETVYNAQDVYVALTDDIDMASVDWNVNIGDDFNASFDGIFDGNNHTISNLNSKETAAKGDGYTCTGLFGAIYDSAVIKNLTLENVTIDVADFYGNNIGALVGFAYLSTGSIENVTVKGDVSINAPEASSVGAIVGYAYNGSLTVSGCKVLANDESAIAAKSQTGAVIGYAGGKSNLTGCEVNNMDISAVGLVGAIAGITCGGTVAECKVSNVDLTATGDKWQNSAAIATGTISVPSTISNITFENVKANGNETETLVGSQYVNKPTEEVGKVQAKNDDVYYPTLVAAMNAAANDETVTVMADVTLTETLTIPADKNITLDLNGNTLTGTPTEAQAYAVIENKGSLTITGEGAVVCDHNLAGSTSYAVNTITNAGNLVIENATIENKSTASNQIGYAIDNNSTTADAVVTVQGGEVKASGSNYYDGIRQFCNNETKENSVTVAGGKVSSIWLQNPSDGAGEKNTKDVKGSVTITGGEVANLYLEPSSEFTASISGGHTGKVSFFETSEGRDLTGFVSGGTFDNPVEDAWCAEGVKPEVNEDGSYGVKSEVTPTPTPTVTETPEPTETATPEPTETATPEPTETEVPTPEVTPEGPTDDRFDIPTEKYSVSAGSSYNSPEYAIDGNAGSHWEVQWDIGLTNPELFWYMIELDEATELDAVRYLPRWGTGAGDTNGFIEGCYVEVSMDGEKWEKVAETTWEMTEGWKVAEFTEPVTTKYIRLTAINTWSDIDAEKGENSNLAIAEIRVRTTEATVEITPAPTEEPTPEVTESPVPTETEAPVPTETEAPVPTETEAPVPTETEAPVPTETPDDKKSVTEIFTDVYDDWYTEYVQYVYDNGLMTGIKGTTEFQPDANITKAQVAQVLYNMEGQPTVEDQKVFTELGDVYDAEWYAAAVAWAYNEGVVTGDLNTKKFNPNADVTREQLALMMFRYAKFKGYNVEATSDFAGLENADKVADWSMDGVKWAVGAGLISGIEKDGVKDLAPQGNASRAQMAAILQRFCENYK